jgi:hypothetical protein
MSGGDLDRRAAHRLAVIRHALINLAVDDLDGILASCTKHGVEASLLPDEPNGRFARILDREGTGQRLRTRPWTMKIAALIAKTIGRRCRATIRTAGAQH